MNFSFEKISISDLLTEMRDALQRNAKRPVIRLEIESSMSNNDKKWICDKLKVPRDHVYSIDGLINLKSCFQLVELERPDLHPEHKQQGSRRFSDQSSSVWKGYNAKFPDLR